MYLANFEREYLERGKREGRKEGMRIDRIQILSHLLEQKFGKLPTPFIHRIKQANDTQLLKWINRVLPAQSIEQIFQ